MEKLIVVGGGLAGAEAAWQAAEAGINVTLYEMRPIKQTGAHTGAWLAELVCSNSLGSNLINRASGLLKEELRRLGSMVLACADQTSVPAGGALAVDRETFARLVTQRISEHPRIEIRREEISSIPQQATIIASGPLTSPKLSQSILALTGQDHLFFYDAIAPLILAESVDMDVAFRGSRYDRGSLEGGDYINCPLSKEQYDQFIRNLSIADRIILKEFELDIENGVNAGAHRYFEGCLPVEILARRSPQALAFGPLRPVGIHDPHTGKRPYAVVQLRQDDRANILLNMVGFQTNLTFEEQKRIFRMIPGLGKAEFVRYGQMHRNTFIFSPELLHPTLQYRQRPNLFFAGQITGVEGYAGNIGTGLLAGINAGRWAQGRELLQLPDLCMLGALCAYITTASKVNFQPMKANFGLLKPISGEKKIEKSQRGFVYAERSMDALATSILQL
jgi:methylenetetrahydrofolate--tRNA-(uracil-5-)-methyltransferase